MDKVKARLVGMKEREKGATGGPWVAGAIWHNKHKVTIQCVDTDTEDPNDSEEICQSGCLGGDVQESANMQFVASARTDWPACRRALERIVEHGDKHVMRARDGSIIGDLLIHWSVVQRILREEIGGNDE